MFSEEAIAKAEDFIRNEAEFQLGFLPTEQSNPVTKDLENTFRFSCKEGVKLLEKADRAVLEKEREVLKSALWNTLADGMLETVLSGGRIVFSGCGATGRLSILLESMWKKACLEMPGMEKYAKSVESIMTGGDYALIRAVEFFEDSQEFGRQQVREMDLGKNDLLAAITEGGETSSVLGTLFEAVDRGAKAFLLFNNPAELLAQRLERSRRAIRNPEICVLDLSCGPMALAGSTRMQATTSEQLCAGSALEHVFRKLAGLPDPDPAAEFEKVLLSLEKEENVSSMAEWIAFEEKLYASNGILTYYADSFLLDIFTDTTERSPTFKLPPFRAYDDHTSPASWAFVKDPLYPTDQVWDHQFFRAPRCLGWKKKDYLAMHAEKIVRKGIPAIGKEEFLKIRIGNEPAPERFSNPCDEAMLILMEEDPSLVCAFLEQTENAPQRKTVSFTGQEADFRFRIPRFARGIGLMEHLALKLVLNNVSTGTMVRFGRVAGNWMSWVDCTNKKLLDRGARLVSDLGKVPYSKACIALFEALKRFEKGNPRGLSPVQYALELLEKEI